MIDRPLRFCMITTFYPPYNFGGDGIFVHRLANELAKRGHQVEVIHCIDSYRFLAKHEPYSQKTYDDHPSITIHGLKSPLGFLSPLSTYMTGFPFFKSKQIREILAKRFDVIHFHNISLVGGPKILKYGQGIKLYTMHEYWLVCPSHMMFRFNRAVCLHPYCFLCRLTYKRPPQLWRYFRLLRLAVKHVDTFIAPSRFIMHIHQHLNIPAVHVPNFVPSGEDSLTTADQFWHDSIEDPYFLFVGRLEKIKGLQTLIPVFRNYHKARLLIAGTGNYGAQLRKIAGDSSNIQFLGYQSERTLQTLYRKAMAVIVPSIWYENFPLVILEAFSQKTPVIARNLGGMAETIQESSGGFVYDTEDELVAAMDQLLADPAYRRELGLKGYQAYQREWTVEAYLQRYFALIYEIAARQGKSLD